MRKVAVYGTVAVVLAVVVDLVHTLTHAGHELLDLPAWQLVYVNVVYYLAPIVAAILLWSRFQRAGAWLLLASMVGSFAFGLVFHFIAPGMDNVFTLEPGPWRTAFQLSAALLLVVDGIGCVVGVWAVKAIPSWSDPGRGAP